MAVTDTTASTAGAAAGALAALPWALIGIEPHLLGIGLFCSLLISLWLPSVKTRTRSFAAVLLSGLAAGALPPVVSTVLVAQFSALADSREALLVPLALIIGTGGPTLIPVLLRRAKATAETTGAQQ